MPHRTPGRRPGYTLIELLVVITIIILLLGLTVGALTAFNGTESAARGASVVQSTLQIARTEAMRSRKPYGVRLVPDATDPNVVIKLEYIYQPDDFYGGIARSPTGATADLSIIQVPNANLFGGFGAANPDRWPVQVGDYIEIKGIGTVRRITQVINATQLRVTPPLTTALPNTTVPAGTTPPNQFRIIRAPRVVGEDAVELPRDIAIDIKANNDYNAAFGTALPVDTQTNAIDILFAPSGAVIGRGTRETPIYLWVRNTTVPRLQGDNTLVVIYPRTGLIAAHPVDTGGDPFILAKDGRSSGL